MNVRESHIVTGMSRDSAVSQHNPNLVYDAHNIRITTKDGNNSVLSVTNERGTKSVPIASSGVQITGTPIGHAIIDKYIVLFTHNEYAQSNKDHIYRCEITDTNIDVSTIFEGDAEFDLAHPVETLSVFETKDIQKVYWVDGKNQPRVINIIKGCPLQTIGGVSSYLTDALNFSRKLSLTHEFSVIKKATGGVFPVGTIQYCFSYYNKFGQESRIIDISPMYYLSPTEKGLDATDTCHSSFSLRIQSPDKTFEYIRVYSIIRTTANGVPQCRIVGDFSMSGVDAGSGITIVDKGIGGRVIDSASLYFIGGEKIIAETLAQKDNTLFLGGITVDRPNVGDLKIDGQKIRDLAKNSPNSNTTPLATIANVEIGYKSASDTSYSPSTANKYYNYSIDNDRSSYFIRRFKYNEKYRLGFIAQYENGQWSEPIWLKDHDNIITPVLSTVKYATGGFTAALDAKLITALKDAGYKRVAPVVVYPNQFARNAIVQGVVCPTVYNYNDRQDNTPYAQSSWFFRFTNMNFFSSGEPYVNHYSIYPAASKYGEIQTMFGESDSGSFSGNGSKISAAEAINNASYQNFYFIDTNIVTLHSPDIECSASPESYNFNNTQLSLVGRAEVGDKVTDHFITIENVGINVEESQVISISRRNADYHCAPLYGDSVVDNTNRDEVSGIRSSGDDSVLVGWITYPWHRSGSLNNQMPLTTAQKSKGFNTRTATLKRNLTANAYFTHTVYADNMTQFTSISVPKLFDSDQLAGVKLSDSGNAYIYYGNIDKVLTPSTKKNFYYVYHGWVQKSDATTIKPMKELSEAAVQNPASVSPEPKWPVPISIDSDTIASRDYVKGSDPVSMKYKSTPHLVVKLDPTASTGIALTDNVTTAKLLYIAELQRTSGTDVADKFGGTDDESFINNAWLRCGDSTELKNSGSGTKLTYLQGDCYFQMYDCLKTYPFTNEDTNSVIELLSVALETYINLDFRYDSNRGGGNNTYINIENFNLFNHLGYEQDNNFFTYHGLDYDIVQTNVFSNMVTWSLEKKMGEDVDTWTSIDATNTLDLDGAMGKLNKLINYNNNIYCFQDIGISQLLFNSRVQIPTSDNTPIEITNGMKMDGKKYISTKIGCTNKWSIIETPLGLYFNDDILKATYLFNGQLTDLSTSKGMKTWMNKYCKKAIWNPDTFNNCRAFYDKVGRDVYWVYGASSDYPEGIALVYSEILGQYMSFMDYGNVPLIESLGNSTYAITSTFGMKKTADIKTPFLAGSVVVDTGKITITLSDTPSKTVLLKVEWMAGGSPRNPQPAATVFVQNYSTYDEVYITIYTCSYYDAAVYTLGEVLTAIQNGLPSYLTASLNVSGANPLGYKDSSMYNIVNTYLTNTQASPFWELGAGEYNMFFGTQKSYWLTFISNTNPTINKIFNTIEWRDIVTDNDTPEPFHTFDHIRVWNENQDTKPVRFSNSLSQDASRQPISYDAAVSNLRKKFNVWRAQIPRDKLATNTGRARISNPWTYIKLSREDINTERHELTDIVVSYFM